MSTLDSEMLMSRPLAAMMRKNICAQTIVTRGEERSVRKTGRAPAAQSLRAMKRLTLMTTLKAATDMADVPPMMKAELTRQSANGVSRPELRISVPDSRLSEDGPGYRCVRMFSRLPKIWLSWCAE